MGTATIRMFLPTGDATGIRTAEVINWTGKAIACPRAQLKELFARQEIDSPGVYVLSGTDPESGEPAIYIGEAESVRSRLRGHKDKDFWVNVTVFISKDENLTKAHVKYLEGKLIERAIECERATLINAASSGARLPEADAADMDTFISKVYLLLPILGADYFSRIEEGSPKAEVFACKIKELTARGRRTANGFVVYKGSQAVLEHRKSAVHTKRRRESLVEKAVLEARSDHYIFTRDYEFSSPSAAGAVVRCGSTNGLTAWKTTTGKTLKATEAE